MAEEGQARQRLAARNAAARALAGSGTEPEAARAVLAALGEGLGWSAGYLWRPGPGGGLAVVESWPDRCPAPSGEMPRAGTPAGRVWETGRAAWFADLAGDAASQTDAGYRTAVAVPVSLGGSAIGVLELRHRERAEEDPELLDLLQSVALQLGGAIDRRRAQRALEESDERLRFQASLLDAVGEAIIATDPNGKIVYWNVSAERLYGWRADEVIGRTIHDVTPAPLSREQSTRIMEQLRAGESWSGEFMVRDRVGREFPVMVTDSPVLDEEGRLRVIIGTSREITERKRFEDAQRFLAEAGRVLASSLDYTHTLSEVCEQSVPLLGDCCIIHLLPESGDGDPAPVARCAPGLGDEETLRMEAAVAGTHGLLQDVITRRVPRRIGLDELGGTPAGRTLRDLNVNEILTVPLHARGHPLGAFTFGRVADSREYDEADERLAEELALRVSSAVDNGRLYRESEESSRAKTDFLAVVSHELRTPLNAITGYADLMASGVSGDLNEAQGRQVERIKVGARHLAHIIDEILAFARVDAGRETLDLSDTDLSELAREAAVVVMPDADAKSLELEVDAPDAGPELLTDGSKVRQVLVNFLSNAVKYTEEGSVTVRVRETEEGVELSVSDTGIGIPVEEHERIFEPFRQIQSPNTRTVGGTGLGLSVNQRLVGLLGGTISVDSVPGEGSTFTIHLPHRPPERNG